MRDDVRWRRASPQSLSAIAICPRFILGPSEHDLSRNAPDAEAGAEVPLGGTELATRAEQVSAPLQRARVADQIPGIAQSLDRAAEQHLGGISATNAKLFAPEDVVRQSLDTRRAGASRESERGIRQRSGAWRSAGEDELRSIREYERPIGGVVWGEHTHRAIEQRQSSVNALRASAE